MKSYVFVVLTNNFPLGFLRYIFQLNSRKSFIKVKDLTVTTDFYKYISSNITKFLFHKKRCYTVRILKFIHSNINNKY